MVIGADGVKSKVGRWAGLMGPLKPKDIECCAEFMVNATDRQVNALLYSLRKMNVENIPVSSIYKTATTSGFPVIKMMRALL